jgi:tRNA threonylcarbamoyladenosine biosynthesis protein TsaE
LSFRSRSPEDTREAGRRLGELIAARARTEEPAIVIGLRGALGAGKTEWVKGLARGLGVAPGLVASPSFVIASEYPRADGRPGLAHVDLYRVDSEAELEAAGFLDLLAPGRVVAVEWADRLPGALPDDHLEVAFTRVEGEPEARQVEVTATGPRARALVEAWRARLGGACAGAPRG